MMTEAGDWQDTLAGALTLMAVAVGPEITSQVFDDTFERACREADKKRKGERAYHNVVVLRGAEAPAATVEALVFQLRSGVDVLRHHGALTRLARLSESQAREVAGRVRKFKPNIAPAWKLDEVEALLRIWSLRHGR
jgi:hypothetical protein